MKPTILLRAAVWICFLFSAFALMISCTTARKATAYFNAHPEVSATYCAEKYPVKDSAGEAIITYSPAPNISYQSTIDSIDAAGKALKKRMYDDSLTRAKDSTKPCVEIAPYQYEINALIEQIGTLQKQYKPCLPDTLYRENTVYRENTARVTSQQLEIDKLKQLLAAATAERDLHKKQAGNRLIWIIGLIALIGVGVFLKIKNIL